MLFENLTTQYFFHHKIILLAAWYRTQSLEYNTCKINVVSYTSFLGHDTATLSARKVGGGTQKLSSTLSTRAEAVEAGGF